MPLNPCSFCTARCCKEYMITVTSFDVRRVVDQTNRKPETFAELKETGILNLDNDTVLECYDEKGLRYDYVLAFRSQPCIFLGQDNRCTIHAIAPLGCRMYPNRPDGSLVRRPLCPAVSRFLFRVQCPGSRAAGYMQQMEAYKELVRRWNAKRGRKEDCLGFLLEQSGEWARYPPSPVKSRKVEI